MSVQNRAYRTKKKNILRIVENSRRNIFEYSTVLEKKLQLIQHYGYTSEITFCFCYVVLRFLSFKICIEWLPLRTKTNLQLHTADLGKLQNTFWY